MGLIKERAQINQQLAANNTLPLQSYISCRKAFIHLGFLYMKLELERQLYILTENTSTFNKCYSSQVTKPHIYYQYKSKVRTCVLQINKNKKFGRRERKKGLQASSAGFRGSIEDEQVTKSHPTDDG